MLSNRRVTIFLALLLILLVPCADAAVSLKSIPGLVIGLYHNGHQPEPDIIPSGKALRFGAFDWSAESGVGFCWFMIKDRPNADPSDWEKELPPGLVLGLKHSVIQPDDGSITVFGEDPIFGPDKFAGGYLRKAHGGDCGCSSGDGFYWYETVNPKFSNWDKAEEELPIGTVLGLRHSTHQPRKSFKWRKESYDPVSCWETGRAPPGFEVRNGGDEGCGSGDGYYWFEKVE